MFIACFTAASLILTSCNYVHYVQDNTGIIPQGTGVSYKQDAVKVLDMGPVKGRTLKLYTTVPDTLNPILSKNPKVHEFSGLIFESLVKLDENMRPVPVLAERWEVSKDGSEWTFYLRDDVRWHDRMRLSAEDVEFTMSVIMDSRIDSIYKDNLRNISSFAALDQRTVRIVLKSPYSFTAEMMTFPILPKHHFYGHDISEMNSYSNMNPVGTGPYEFRSFDGNVIKLSINDNWWGAHVDDNDENEPGRPYITEIEIKVFNNVSEALDAFKDKDIELITADAYQCSSFAGRSDIFIKKYPNRNYEFLAFNLANPKMGDPSVRKAISLAINRKEIIDNVLPGEAVTADMPVIPGTWIYGSYTADDDISDAKKAHEFLLENGWRESNGVLYKNIRGVRTYLRLELLVNKDNGKRIRVAEEIKRQLLEAGIDVRVKEVNWEEGIKLISEKKFDIVLIGCRVPAVPDPTFMFSSNEAAGSLNIAGYSNATVDGYLDRIAAETDEVMRKIYFANLCRLVKEDLPYLGLYFYNDATIFTRRIRGPLSPFVYDRLNGLESCYLLAE